MGIARPSFREVEGLAARLVQDRKGNMFSRAVCRYIVSQGYLYQVTTQIAIAICSSSFASDHQAD